MPNKLLLLLAIGATAAVSTLCACGTDVDAAREPQFEADLEAHGVPESIAKFPNLGGGACTSVEGGQAPGNWALQMANPPANLTIQQALVAVYWAIKDLCPDQMDKGVKDFWKDEIYNPPTPADTEPPTAGT